MMSSVLDEPIDFLDGEGDGEENFKMKVYIGSVDPK